MLEFGEWERGGMVVQHRDILWVDKLRYQRRSVIWVIWEGWCSGVYMGLLRAEQRWSSDPSQARRTLVACC